ncbi:NAD(P)-binding domain-containing protein [Candidatus Nesciobacter abundans]|uniref:Flavoprotein n=1 Tax=Candidatus Nesciobacter abundans TaxID=2601668 RepID=A0A5C0UK24_9PROT|nr:NAD(P)-binding domain-containing protein [Candidatus Nesciobacter abundans]QEK39204.1 flavoprotein [Candidatus Nesciobacter abundans]
MKSLNKNTIAVIGAGPVGISAAVHLKIRGLNPIVFEKGSSVGHAMKEWGHVRVFTPWKYVMDKEVVNLLGKTDWKHPDKEYIPTGNEIVEEYLYPASKIPELKNRIIYGAEVIAVSKSKSSKSSSNNRDEKSFTIHYKSENGSHYVTEVNGVIDASGTWGTPNPIGADGLPVIGEIENKEYISYGIPDILLKNRNLYEGKRVLVLGSGHSAINVVLDILSLKNKNLDTKLIWGLRNNKLDKLLGGGINDELPARGALGQAAKKAISEGSLDLMAPFEVKEIERKYSRNRSGFNGEFIKREPELKVKSEFDGKKIVLTVDRIIVAAGFRPNLDMLRELRLDLDTIVEAPKTLAPMIDPNLHSCGTVKPHGVDELSHPDKNFFIVGMKAYGRAPTFLMLTGYEQVRSIADELAGNHEAAREVQLKLPETGVCNSNSKNIYYEKALDKKNLDDHDKIEYQDYRLSLRSKRSSCCGADKEESKTNHSCC